VIRACAVCALLLTAATPAFALQDGEYSAAVAATAQSDIIPAYQALEQAAGKLQEGLDSLCKAPDPEALEDARRRFADLAAAWARIQYVSFGPVDEDQRAFRIEYWPDKRNIVGRQLAGVLKEENEAALEPQHFATTTVGVQGLPALDRLLFE
jgi:predicted lipoprotein